MKKNADTTSSRGYAILFAVLMVSIILAIALGVLNVALKEFKFAGTARNSHISFFAADTGGECALYAKKNGMLNGVSLTTPPSMICDTQTVTSTGVDLGNSVTQFQFQPIAIQNGCALVDIVIDNSSTQVSKTTINAHGYNVVCANLSNNAVTKIERLLSYEFTDVSGTGNNGTGGGTGTGGTTATTGNGIGGTIMFTGSGGLSSGGTTSIQLTTGGTSGN